MTASGELRVSARAVELWAMIRAVQERGDACDQAALSGAVAELRRALGIPLTCEPHRIADDQVWRWASLPEHVEHWRKSKALKDALDRALASEMLASMSSAAGHRVVPKTNKGPP